jgi:hypothetical protein
MPFRHPLSYALERLNQILGPLGGGTTNLQPGQPPSIQFDAYPRAVQRPDGAWDFGVADAEWRRYSMVQLIKDRHSTLYNTGELLVKKMVEIQKEGQVYYWKIDPDHRYTDEQQRLYEGKPQRGFIEIGDHSEPTPVGKKGKTIGDFDRLRKWEGTTNCSTAVLDALYRTLGGKVSNTGKVITIGGVNGVPLTDKSFSGFNHKFQGPEWAEALEEYDLGYQVKITELKRGDIIGTGGHRMVYLKAIEERDGKPTKISAIQANLPTGTIAIKVQPFSVADHWKLARLFDMKE